MADENTIRVVITGVAADLRRALEGAKGDLGGLSAAIKAVPDKIKIDVQVQSAAAMAQLGGVKALADSLPDNVTITVDADTSGAEAKLGFLRSLMGGGSGGGLIPGAGVLFNPFGTPATAATGYVAGGATLAGPALGLGAILTSGLGALTAGIAPLAILSGGIRDAIKLSGQLQTATDKVATAQANYGKSSKQAKQAQQDLNTLIAQANGPTLAFAKSWGKLSDALAAAEQQVLPLFSATLQPLLSTLQAFLPTLERMAKIDLGGLGKGLQIFDQMLSSSGFQALLVQLSHIFAQLAPILFQQLVSLLQIFLRVSVAAGPAMLAVSNAWAGILAGIARFVATPQFQTMLNQWTDSFILLMKALLPLVGPLMNIATALVPAFTKVLQALVPVINTLVVPALNGIADFLRTKWGQAFAIAAIVLLPGGPILLGLAALGLAITHVKDIAGFFRDAWKAIWGAVQTAFDTVLNFLLGGISTLLGAIKAVLDTANVNLPIIGHVFGSGLGAASKAVGDAQRSIDEFRKTLQPTADTVRQTTGVIGSDYAAMTLAVGDNITAMGSAVHRGLSNVQQQLFDSLKALGVTNVKAVIKGALGAIGLSPASSPTATSTRATGGLVQIGRPGEKGRDTIPLSVGGMDIIVGAGEKVAVFNDQQQQVMDSRLADVGGLSGMFQRFNRPHWMAGGGIVTGRQITPPAWTGPGGVAGEIGNRILDIAAGAANKVLGQVPAASTVGVGVSSGTPINVSGNLASWLQAGMALAGVSGPLWLPMLSRQAMRESTGNPSVINTWDINAQRGDPSEGLLQTTLSTFAKYMVSGHGNILNPVDNTAAAIRYMIATYGGGDANRAVQVMWARGGGAYARGGFIPAARGLLAHAATYRPPARASIKHPRTPRVSVPRPISDALKRLLPGNVVGLDATAARYAQRQVDLSGADDQLTYEQGLAPYPAQALVTLTDADVAAIDPHGTLGYQAGDQIVNQSGMVVGRFFGPHGIDGGSWVPGIDQRQGQIGAQLSNLYGQQSALVSAGLFYGKASDVELRARTQRDQRRRRVLAFLRRQVIHAKAIQAELQAITTGNLQQNLARSLSRQAIGRRLSSLRSNKTAVSEELRAEKASQAALIPIERDPAHTQALQAQLDQINQSIGVETQLQSGGAATQAVQAARSALLRDTLRKRLAAYATVDKTLGGSPYDVGSGGIIGQLTKQIDALDSNRSQDLGNKKQLAPALQMIKNAIAAYLYEQGTLPGTSAIQVRTPLTSAGTPVTPAQTNAALLALVQQKLANVVLDLATSQSQFGVLSGFAPLLAGRLVGTFQSGIDFVPKTGLALVHRGETITPDPSGPQGNRAAATVHTQQGDVVVELRFENNEAPLVKLMDARINQRAMRVVSDHAGQRARLMSGVRRP
jgi:SLT domain-containing protein